MSHFGVVEAHSTRFEAEMFGFHSNFPHMWFFLDIIFEILMTLIQPRLIFALSENL